MKLDLGLLRLDLPDGDDAMVPMMFIAMGTKDEKEALSVGPTMAKSQSAQFRRTLTVNVTARAEDEETDEALKRSARELVARVRGKPTQQTPREIEGVPGLFTEFTHEGQNKTALVSLCWIGCKDRAIYTVNMTGLALPKTKKAMDAQIDGIVRSLAFDP